MKNIIHIVSGKSNDWFRRVCIYFGISENGDKKFSTPLRNTFLDTALI